MAKEYKNYAFAQIDADNNVTNRLMVSERDCMDENEVFDESVGANYMKELFGSDWLLSEVDGSRKGYGDIGCTYDKTKDAFIHPKPFDSWTLNEGTCHWNAPVAYPDDGKFYNWNEDTTSWDELT